MYPTHLLDPVPEVTAEPEPEPMIDIVPEVLTEPEPEPTPEIPDIYKHLAILNIILWILFFIGAFDD